MKKPLLFIGLLFGCLASVNSQIVVDRSDFPHVGDLVVTATDNTTTVTPGNAGLNQTWDFSNLVAEEYDSAVFVLPAQAVNSQYYPSANMASMTLNPESGYAYGFYHDSGSDIGIAGIDVQGILMPGFYLNMHMQYLDEAWFQLPYHYGDSHTQTYWEVGYAAMYNNGVMLDSSKTSTHVTRQMEVDASGTMITPTGSFPVLRVHETESWVDSSFVWSNNAWVFESAQPRSNESYAWYGKNYGLIGKLDVTSGRANGISFFVSETVVGVSNPSKEMNLNIYPNPATENLILDTESKIERVMIYDMTGSLKLAITGSNLISVARLDKGTYLLNIYTNDGMTSRKFIRQ